VSFSRQGGGIQCRRETGQSGDVSNNQEYAGCTCEGTLNQRARLVMFRRRGPREESGAGVERSTIDTKWNKWR